jgi:hypothetical protein
MKFCYLDESGTGSEPFSVMASIIVDSQRMHILKNDWKDLLNFLSEKTKKNIKEFHSRDFYSGNGPWRTLDGNQRKIITIGILEWLKKRKHAVCFCAVDKDGYFKEYKSNQKMKDIGSLWSFMALHHLLSLQKYYQKSPGVKGHTLCIFDNEPTELNRISNLSINPPDWTNSYYLKNKKTDKLSHIIDVPYFGDSEKINLLQIADLLAYLIRVYIELKEGKVTPKYADHIKDVTIYMELICKLSIPSSATYPKIKRCECSNLFYKYAPPAIKDLKY